MNRDRDIKGRFLKSKSKEILKFSFGRSVKTPTSTLSLVGKHIMEISIGESKRKTQVLALEITPNSKEVIEHRSNIVAIVDPPSNLREPTTKSIIVRELKRKLEEGFKVVVEPKFSLPKIVFNFLGVE